MDIYDQESLLRVLRRYPIKIKIHQNRWARHGGTSWVKRSLKKCNPHHPRELRLVKGEA